MKKTTANKLPLRNVLGPNVNTSVPRAAIRAAIKKSNNEKQKLFNQVYKFFRDTPSDKIAKGTLVYDNGSACAIGQLFPRKMQKMLINGVSSLPPEYLKYYQEFRTWIYNTLGTELFNAIITINDVCKPSRRLERMRGFARKHGLTWPNQ